ncbi:hypothetical protein Zmor_022883 [Zophobas morio]|uniref:Uncharacterized protein n=1 Tax=Zophobas morio TaxID=2755281 RepID=A0AA38M713_9CUCU|nr:hypothetical protein Zmor_022883 [Zophobas morio]
MSPVVRLPGVLGRIGKKQLELASLRVGSALAYGTTTGLIVLYAFEWKDVLQYVPYYNGNLSLPTNSALGRFGPPPSVTTGKNDPPIGSKHLRAIVHLFVKLGFLNNLGIRAMNKSDEEGIEEQVFIDMVPTQIAVW